MKHEKKVQLINNVIENEFNHIRKGLEGNDEFLLKERVIGDVYEKILKKYKDNKEIEGIIEKIDNEVLDYVSFIIRFYFKEGVKAGTTNLNFLKNTDIMEYV